MPFVKNTLLQNDIYFHTTAVSTTELIFLELISFAISDYDYKM